MTYNEALDRFLKLLNERDGEYYTKNFPNLPTATFTVSPGRVYDKIVRNTPSRSAYCFIMKSTGGIYKGNWKAVCAPKVERGNIYDDSNPLGGTEIYGIVYLRG